IAPISPALHLGATRVLVIGVTATNVDTSRTPEMHEYPTLAQIAGHAMNSIFLDNMEVDLERLKKNNELITLMPDEFQKHTDFCHVDVLVISPSQPLEKIAERYAKEMPWTIRLLLRMIGARPRRGDTLLSYLLSDSKYCSALIDLGYQDAMHRREEIMRFLNTDSDYNSRVPQ
ncbi:MAG: patatin-like phospholipase family protein, partial [Burkholderiales bacterium]|nr:patatin-like phospholipase family protein [Burkholderiales bacterium]